MGKRFEELNMKVPNAKPILGYKGNLPFYCDKIFMLKTSLMRSYPGTRSLAQKVFDCRLFRARCTTENYFCILAAR